MYSKETKKRTLTEVKGDTDGREGWAVPTEAIPDPTLALGAWRSRQTRRCEKRVFPSKMALAVGRGEAGERAGWTERHKVAQWPQQVGIPQRAMGELCGWGQRRHPQGRLPTDGSQLVSRGPGHVCHQDPSSESPAGAWASV